MYAVSVVLMHAWHKMLTHVISSCCNLLHLVAFSANFSLMWGRGVSKHFDMDTNPTQIIHALSSAWGEHYSALHI